MTFIVTNVTFKVTKLYLLFKMSSSKSGSGYSDLRRHSTQENMILKDTNITLKVMPTTVRVMYSTGKAGRTLISNPVF